MTHPTAVPTIRLYAAGGAAINIVSDLYQETLAPKSPGFAKLEFAFLDTSDSNVTEKTKASFYHVRSLTGESIDGSGKVRATNSKAVSTAIPEIIECFPPGDLSIVIHSGGGGSGSVVSPLLVAELLKRNHPVFSIIVGSTTCEQEIENTIKSLQTYQNLAQKLGRPIAAQYFENGKHFTAPEIDLYIRTLVLMHAVLWSGENKGLDRQDLVHFLDYTKVSKFPPAFVGLRVDSGKIAESQKGHVVSSVVTLVRENDDPAPGALVGYHAFGYVSPDSSDALQTPTPLHFQIVQGYFTETFADLQKKLKEAQDRYGLLPVLTIDVPNVGDDLLVL